MVKRGLTSSMPIWVRVSGIIALVLVGVVVGSMLLDSRSMGQMGGMDHSGGSTGQAAPSASMPAEQPAHSGQQGRPSLSATATNPATATPSDHETPTGEGGPHHGTDDQTPSDRPRDH